MPQLVMKLHQYEYDQITAQRKNARQDSILLSLLTLQSVRVQLRLIRVYHSCQCPDTVVSYQQAHTFDGGIALAIIKINTHRFVSR